MKKSFYISKCWVLECFIWREESKSPEKSHSIFLNGEKENDFFAIRGRKGPKKGILKMKKVGFRMTFGPISGGRSGEREGGAGGLLFL